MDDTHTIATVSLPYHGDGQWVEALIPAPEGGATLERAALGVEPDTAFRIFRVYRASDGQLLANGGWDRTRTRPIKIIPASTYVGPGDAVRFTARGWYHTALEGIVTWRKDGGDAR